MHNVLKIPVNPPFSKGALAGPALFDMFPDFELALMPLRGSPSRSPYHKIGPMLKR